MNASKLGFLARSHEFNSVMEKMICTDAQSNVLEMENTAKQLVSQFNLNRVNGNAVYLIGNGGSASAASHALTDFLNVCRLRAFTLHDHSLITCMANDFGYENAYARIVKTVLRPSDILIAISSSGKSANICNAAKIANEQGGIVITMSGFNQDNPLRKLGDINFWLDSCDYGIVEIGHLFILHNISDRIGVHMKTQVNKFEQVL